MDTDNRLKVPLTPEQDEWVRSRAEELGIPRCEVVSRAIDSQRLQLPAQKPKVAKKDKRSPRERVIDAVRNHFNLAPAALEAGVQRDDIVAWCSEDPGFRKQVEEAQACYIAQVESDLVALGRGDRRGSQKALEAFLGAHHPGYGRLKLELLKRILDPLVDRLMRFMHQEFGPQAAEQLARVRERFEREKQKRLVAFT